MRRTPARVRGAQLEISLGLHSSGKLIGLTGKAVYLVDPGREEIIGTWEAPVPIGCGFALVREAVYFAQGRAVAVLIEVSDPAEPEA